MASIIYRCYARDGKVLAEFTDSRSGYTRFNVKSYTTKLPNGNISVGMSTTSMDKAKELAISKSRVK